MKTLSYFSMFFLILVLTVSFSVLPASSQARPEAIRVAMDNNYPPYVFQDGAGALQGILIDQWRLWEQKTGIPVTINALDWNKALRGMKAGEYDVIDTIFRTDERSGWLDFSAPYAQLEVPIFFYREISGITDAASLKGFIVAAKAGDNAVDILKQNGVNSLILFNSYEEVVRNAKEHKAPVFVVDKPPALYFLHKFGISKDYRQSAPLYSGQFHRAVRKGNSKLLATVEDGFRMISSDDFKKIDVKWNGTALKEPFPATAVLAGLAGLSLLVLILFVWNRTLKNSVKKQTAELKSNEKVLRRNEEKFRAFFEQGYYLAGLMSTDGTLTDVNDTALQFIGVEKENVIGKPFWETPWWSHSPEMQEKLRAAIQTAAEGSLVRLEVTHLTADGTLRIIDFSLRPVKEPSGKVIFLVPEGRDITERKKAEDELEESREKYRGLSDAGFEAIFFSEKGICTEQNRNAVQMFGYSDAEAVGRCGTEWIAPEDRDLVMKNMISGYEEPYEVTALRKDGTSFPALIRAKMMHYRGTDVRVTSLNDISDRKKIEEERLNLERQLLHAQKLESLGILSGGIAHDFNNLLLAVLGNLDLALMKLPHETPAHNNIGQAIKAARHAAKLTNMMLAYAGKALFIVKPLNLTELVEENITMWDAAISKSVTLEQHLDHTLPMINADAGQLQQVIMNLITNAAEAIGDASGSIRLATGFGEFDQSALNESRLEEKAPAGCYVWLEVSDNGCGMDGETLHKLFDPFFTTKFTGRGLGMSAVLGIIRGHKGAFLVKSVPGEGTTIRVLLPALTGSPGETDQINRHTALHDLIGHNLKVLIIDDEEPIRTLSVDMLSELGFETMAAESGEEGLTLFTEAGNSIDIVLLDQVMPGMDGVSTFRGLRSIRPDVKVILASGFSQQEVSERFAGLGLNGFLPKPYVMKDLAAVLLQVLNGSEA